jgi:hypothetical protein
MKTVFSKKKYIEVHGIKEYVKNQEMVNRCDGLIGKEILKLGYKLHTNCMVDLDDPEEKEVEE